MINKVIAVLIFSASLCLGGTHLKLDWTATRGSVVYDGTSLGAYTSRSDYWSFQGTEVYADHLSYQVFPTALLDPTNPQSAVYAVGDPATIGFSSWLFLPYVADPSNPTIPTLGYYTYVPGSLGLTTTAGVDSLRWSGGFRLRDPVGGIGNYTFTGLISGGTTAMSFAFRSDLAVIVGKSTGTYTLVPEPGTLWYLIPALPLLVWKRVRNSRRGATLG